MQVLVCPRCQNDMKQYKENHFKCPSCKARAHQLSLFNKNAHHVKKQKGGNMVKKCVQCGSATMNKRSSYCEDCFEALLKEKVKGE